MQPSKRWSRLVAFVSTTAGSLLALSSGAGAQVSVGADTKGMPGASMAQQVLNWGAGLALMACAGAVVYGGAKWRGGVKSGNGYGAQDGKEYVIGGFVGAAIVGLAALGVNTMFKTGQGG